MLNFTVVNGLACLLLITSQMIIFAGDSRRASWCFSAQSLVLVLIFLALAQLEGSKELYAWSASAFLTKVVLIPFITYKAFGRLQDDRLGAGNVLPPAGSLALTAVVVGLCFVVVMGITLPGAAHIKPALAISLAHFFLGVACIAMQRNILKQVFGYCLMENGSHLTLALLAANAPALVEVGIATDAIFGVIVMTLLGTRIFRSLRTLDARELMSLKG